MAYNKQSHYNNVWNRCMLSKKDREFMDKITKEAVEELEKAGKILIEAAKDKTIKDLDWWNSKDRNIYELIYECFKLAATYRPDHGRKIVNEIFDTYGRDTAVCRSIRRHLIEGTPFSVEEDEQ